MSRDSQEQTSDPMEIKKYKKAYVSQVALSAFLQKQQIQAMKLQCYQSAIHLNSNLWKSWNDG